MHRRSMRASLVAVAAVAALTLAACSSGSSTSGTTTSAAGSPGSATSGSAAGTTSAAAPGELTIEPLYSIDSQGNQVEPPAAANAANPAGDGTATCSNVAIAMAGALTGPNAALGINILNGAKMAVAEHNQANANCQVTLKEFDTEGNPEKATQVAPQIIDDEQVIGLLGPAFSGETDATGDRFFQAGLLSLTASATRSDLTQNGWTNFFRGLGNDNSQGGATANYMTGELGLSKICVVSDNTAYGLGLAAVVTETLGDVADSNCAAEVKEGDKDFSATVNLIQGESPDGVYYAGYYAEGGPFALQLRDAGVTATFVSGDGVNDPQFVEQAGSASAGAILTCPCGPAPADFAAKYEAASGAAPGVYSVDAYDLTTIILLGIDSGITDRAALIEWVRNYDGQGISKEYKWDSVGELAVQNPWIYKVQ